MKSILSHLEGKSHVIWDWNGTLLNDIDLMVEVIGELLDEHSLPRINREQYCELFGFPIKNYYRALGFNFDTVTFEHLSDKFMAGYRRGLPSTELHTGMKELLGAIHHSKISQSVLSAAQEVYLEEQLKHFGIRHFFDHVYGLSDYHAAGKLERGMDLMQQAGLPKESTLLIGDTDHDLEVGQALGIEVLLLADGHQSFRRLEPKHHKILKNRYEAR